MAALFLLLTICIVTRVLTDSCEPMIKDHPCRDVPYVNITVPNWLSHPSQEVAIQELNKVFNMNNLTIDQKILVCSVYAPSCKYSHPLIPCRSLCRSIKHDSSGHKIIWPSTLDCNKFPEAGGYCRCYAGRRSKSPSYNSTSLEKAITTNEDYQCVTLMSTSPCRDLYNTTMFPNVFNHSDQESAELEMRKFYPLINTECSSNLKVLLCSLYAPKCGTVPPCKSLCQSVKKGCEPVLGMFSLDWPKEMECEKFPTENCLHGKVEAKPRQTVEEKPLVTLPCGTKIMGTKRTSRMKREFYQFQGIPYAEPPIGDLRFKPPAAKRAMKSHKPLDATKEGADCAQLHFFMKFVVGKEDCLFLNVYTRNINNTQVKRPVMVFIHGGGFSYGSSSSMFYKPHLLMDYDVVFVSMNYRLHILGFLSTMDEASPGNYGLLDQLEALKWVQKNIHMFGGDPNNVNIFGESAGGSSVVHQMLSPLSKGLFHSAISMSGNALNRFALSSNPFYWTKRLADDFGCSITNTTKMVHCLRMMPIEKLTNKQGSYKASMMTAFLPTVDNYFLTETPYNLLKQGKLGSRVPLMMGVTKDEGLLFLGMYFKSRKLCLTDDLLVRLLSLSLSVEPKHVTKKAVEALRKEYFHSVNETDYKTIRRIVSEIFSDALFKAHHYQAIELLTENNIELFVYQFDHNANQTLAKIFGVTDIEGVAHADDLSFLFMSQNKQASTTEDILLQMWTKFAEHGHPTKYITADIPQWETSKSGNFQIYHLNDVFQQVPYDTQCNKRWKFWIEVIPRAMLNQTS